MRDILPQGKYQLGVGDRFDGDLDHITCTYKGGFFLPVSQVTDTRSMQPACRDNVRGFGDTHLLRFLPFGFYLRFIEANFEPILRNE